jgi:2,3-bisphosphoglycerate-independent phosphoglycerate mutase
VEAPHEGEEHVLVESRKDVRTHDEAPEMRAKEIADAALARLEDGIDFLFINFANADMVGHTANVPALHTALEAVDTALERVVRAVEDRGGFALITADHGNAERNFDEAAHAPHTAHTTNPVPLICTRKDISLRDGSLPDITPTLLHLMGIQKPACMTGEVLATDVH